MRHSRLAVIPLCALFVTMDCLAESVFVNLRHEAEIDNVKVRLSDIAEIITQNGSVAEQLGSAVVYECASFAPPCRLTKRDAMASTLAQARQLGADVIWGSNEVVTVRGRMRTLSLSPAIDQAAIRILQRIANGHPLALKVMEGPTLIEAPPGKVDFKPEFERIRWVDGNIELPINVRVNGSSVAKPIVRYALQRNLISASAEQGDDKQQHFKRTAGSMVNVQGDSMVQNSESSPIIKNRKVRLLVDSGTVRIETEGVALENASIGESVVVRRPNSLADVHGRAIDRGIVLVEEN